MDIVSKGIPNCFWNFLVQDIWSFYGYKGAYYNID